MNDLDAQLNPISEGHCQWGRPGPRRDDDAAHTLMNPLIDKSGAKRCLNILGSDWFDHCFETIGLYRGDRGHQRESHSAHY
jgi:hypothetical protein